MKSIFLSYSHRDKDIARDLVARLTAHGVDVWRDEDEMSIGTQVPAHIASAIQMKDYLGVLLTPASVNSEWVHLEVQIALAQELEGRFVKVLPLLMEPTKVPEYLRHKLYADFTSNAEDAFQRLLDCLLSPNPPERGGHGEVDAHGHSTQETDDEMGRWLRWLASLRRLRDEQHDITAPEYSALLRYVAGAHAVAPSNDVELCQRLRWIPSARDRALLAFTMAEVATIAIDVRTARRRQILVALNLNVPIARQEAGIRFLLLPPGCLADGRRHDVPCYVAERVVTRAHWAGVLGSTPLDDEPMVGMSAHQIHCFLEQANTNCLCDPGYELSVPTPDEWAYAAVLSESHAPGEPVAGLGLRDFFGVAEQYCEQGHGYPIGAVERRAPRRLARGHSLSTDVQRSSLGFRPVLRRRRR